MIIILINFVH